MPTIQEGIRPSARAAEKPLEPRSFALSLAVHLAVIAALLGWWRGASPRDLHVMPVRIVFSRGSAGAAGGGGATASAGTASKSPAPRQAQTAPPAAPLQQQAPKVAPAMTAETAPHPVPPLAVPVPVPAPAAPTAMAALPPPPPPAHPLRKPAPPVPPLPQVAVAALAPPRPVPPGPPVAMPAASQPAVAAAPAPAAAGSGSGAAAGPGRGLANAGSGQGAFGSHPGEGDDWLDAVRRRLFAFMKNPNDGRADPAYGTVWLRITVARDGRVLGSSIQRSSGVPYLDAAALRMVQDAAPLPPLPGDITAERVTFAIPAQYEPGLFERLFR